MANASRSVCRGVARDRGAAAARLRPAGEDRVGGAEPAARRSVQRRSAANVAAAVFGLAREVRTELRGVLPADACAGRTRAVGFYGYARARGDDRRREVRAPAISLCADVLELGVGVDLDRK